ncbi:MAG: hypothetical protein JO017_02915 [Actinobacteria bacterium]|nr:hypothetical protein [Actinomycetota bacterium]
MPLIGVFAHKVVWIAVVGGILLSVVYVLARGGPGGIADGRQRNRNRNRNRG